MKFFGLLHRTRSMDGLDCYLENKLAFRFEAECIIELDTDGIYFSPPGGITIEGLQSGPTKAPFSQNTETWRSGFLSTL